MKLADFILRHRIWLLTLGVFSWAAAAFFASKLEANYSFWKLFVADDPEVVRQVAYVDQWGDDSALIFVGLRSGTGDIFTPGNLALLDELEHALAAVEHIDETTSILSSVTVTGRGDEMSIGPLVEGVPSSPQAVAHFRARALENRLLAGTLISETGNTAMIALRLGDGLRDAADRNPVVVEVDRVARQRVRGSDLTAYITGIPIAQWVYSTDMVKDLGVFTTVSVVLLAVILLLMFRSFSGMALPLAVVAAATTNTMATLAITGQQIDMINTSIPTLMLVIGIADAIHIMSHFRRRIGAGDNREDAIRHTVRAMGTACLLTSVTTAVGFASLVSANIGTVRYFGIYSAIGIMYAFAANILIIPIGLSFLRPRAAMRAAESRDGPLVRGLLALGAYTQRRPWFVLGVSAAVIGTSLFGMSLVQIQSRMFEEISEDDPVVRAHRELEKDLPGIVSYALDVFTEPGQVIEPATLRALEAMARHAEAHPAVDRAMGLPDLIKEMNRATHGGDPKEARIPDNRELIAQYVLLAEGDATERILDADYSRTQIWMRGPEVVTPVWEELRAQLEEQARRLQPGVQVLVTGGSSMAQRALDSIVTDILTSLLVATGIIFILMTLLFRSLRIGLLSMVPNLIPLIITTGIMGFTGVALRTSTVVIFSISIGLAVDDTIHFLVRYGRERARGRDVSAAVMSTMKTAGRPIVYTSILLCGGFWVLLLSSFNATRDVGLLGGVTLFSALFADLFVLPALLKVAHVNVAAPGANAAAGPDMGVANSPPEAPPSP